MKLVVWIVFAIAALFWTAGAVLVAELVKWTTALLASGAPADLGQAIAQWPVPLWLAPWVDPSLVSWAREAVRWALQGLQGSAPSIGAALAWLVPVVWLGWGLGITLMLVVAGGAHFVIARLARPRPAA